MPLARIISRSLQCSRELALDLMARGYAVEIVSPDAIPDGFADLELRVESDDVNDVTAAVAARDGGHVASLDFIHHLKAPMSDFVRRSPESASVPAQPVSVSVEPPLPKAGEPSVPAAEPKPVRRGITITIHRSRPKGGRPSISSGRILRAAMMLAAATILALVLGRGIRRAGAPASQGSQNDRTKTPASTTVSSTLPAGQGETHSSQRTR
jgi:hypothetical protein